MRNLIAALALLSAAAFGQTTITPDCAPKTYTLTTTGATVDVNNITTGCVTWTMEYQAVGFSAISLSFQGAPAATLTGTPTAGSYTNWGGTIANGVNPVIVSPGAGATRFTDVATAATQGYFASFVRVNLTSITGTGTVTVTFYGYKTGAQSNNTGGGGGGGCTGLVAGEVVFGGSGGDCAQDSHFTYNAAASPPFVGFEFAQLTAIAAPTAPASGLAKIYEDSSSLNMALKNSANVVNHGIQTQTCGSQVVQSIADDGTVTCASGAGPTPNENIRSPGVHFDGNGSALTGSITTCYPVYYSGTISQVVLIADVSGNATVDVRTVAFASYTGPSSASSITAADTPALASAVSFSDTTLTGWTTTIAANTVVCFVLTSPSGVNWVDASLKVTAN